MELNTGRLEGSSRIEPGRFGQAPEGRRRGAPQRRRADGSTAASISIPAEDEALTGEEQQNHQLDDLA